MAKARPAKDLKPTGARAKFLIEGKQRQLRKSAEEMRKKAKAQAKDKQPRPAKDIQKGSAREKILKDSRAGKIKAKPPVVTGSSASSLVRTGAARLIGAVGAIVDPSFMSYKTGGQAGPGSDKPERMAKPYTPGGPKSRQGSQAPSMKTASTSMDKRISESAKLERLRATRAASAKTKTYKEKNLEANQKVGAAASAKAKAEAKPAVAKKKKEQPRPAFKGNWVGAAPTEMQKRGGARIKRPNLLSLLKKKK